MTHVILTHSHYDHSLNWIMFRQARIRLKADVGPHRTCADLEGNVTPPGKSARHRGEAGVGVQAAL